MRNVTGHVLAAAVSVPVLLVVVGSAAAEAGRRKHLGAWWAVPVLVPVSTGAVLALAAWQGLPEGLSGTVPIVIGVTAAACMALLQATYTGARWMLRARNDAV